MSHFKSSPTKNKLYCILQYTCKKKRGRAIVFAPDRPSGHIDQKLPKDTGAILFKGLLSASKPVSQNAQEPHLDS